MQGERATVSAAFKAHARKELIDLLDSVRGKKGLVLDPSLSGPLSLIAEVSLLKEHGVDKIYHLSAEPFTTDCTNLIYICRPKLEYARWIAAHLQANNKTGKKISYSLFFVPRRTLLCERVLEEEGVYGEITLGEYHLDLIALEDDLLSLENGASFRELFLDGDPTVVYSMAKALMKLQTMFGIIPRICGKGQQARALADLLLRMRHELVANASDALQGHIFPARSEINSLVIIDRSVDFVTPLCTQLTYEGLVDEVIGIRSTFVEVDATMVGGAPQATGTSAISSQTAKTKKVPLNGSDPLFTQMRDLNFAVVGGLLSQIARRIHDDYEGRHQAKTVTQIKDFIGKLGNLQSEHQSLRLHTGIAEKLTTFTKDSDFNGALEVQQNFVAGISNKTHLEYLETMIDKQASLEHTLRLLSLYSLVEGGIKPKVYDQFRRDIVQTYGHTHILTLQNLSKANLLRKQDPTTPRSPFPQLRKLLRLIVDDVNEHKPNDISYVYSGYAPLSVRLVQAACYKNLGGGVVAANLPAGQQSASKNVGWKGWEEALRLVPGPTFDELQKGGERDGGKGSKDKPPLTVVVFLGGCTYTEVAAIRFLAQQEGQREFVILTTNMVNGNSIIKSMTEEFNAAASPSA
ncbi:Sec1-like protein [Fimicolochytrium jonesii]|uniref:Sec1-like protein n=1 Tax=Fimicolochytrium jonesii TaxID=1396493 RepID=UPI0022FF077A|nr:Sec1-like protein [Fimicolochytrium jonesii]KAI8827289.1 Sec1-like protein [Fimicolochytrium jonesii]